MLQYDCLIDEESKSSYLVIAFSIALSKNFVKFRFHHKIKAIFPISAQEAFYMSTESNNYILPPRKDNKYPFNYVAVS